MTDHITRGLSDLMRDAQESLEADAAQAPAEVSDYARSRRRRSGALLATVAVVACVSVGAASIGVANGGSAPEPAFSASPSAVPAEDLSVPLATTTISIDGGPEYSGYGSMLECGAPAPPPTGTVSHFGVTIAEPPPLSFPADAAETGISTTVETWITYDSQASIPVEQLPVMLILVKDGKVAGSFSPDSAAQIFWTYSDFETFYGGSSLAPWNQFCPEVSADGPDQYGWNPLDPGEYQVIPVTRVWASEEAAALKYQYSKGVEVAERPFGEDAAEFLPGSWDCKRMVQNGYAPRACLGDAAGGAIVDMTAGTVTLPYDPEQFTKPLDVTLVGDPVALTVPEALGAPDFIAFEPKALDTSDPVECGTTFDYIESQAPFTMSGEIANPMGLGPGAFNATNALVLVEAQGTGTLDLEYGATAWLVSGVAPEYNYFEDRPGALTVVGSAEVSFAGGNSVEYDRYEGPTLIDLIFTNVTLCEGVEEYPDTESAIIDGNFALTPTGDEPGEHIHQLLEFRKYWF